MQFSVRNPGKRLLRCDVVSDDPALSLLTRHLTLRSREELRIVGVLVVGPGSLGRRSYRIRCETPVPAETRLIVDVVPRIAQVEFVPPELAIRLTHPGMSVQRNLTLNNTGNVAVSSRIAASEPWLGVLPAKVTLAPGESCLLKVAARTRKTDWGERTGQIRISPDEGVSVSAQVRLQLPEPKLEAEGVDFGEIRSDHPSYEAALIRNIGKVRVACTLTADQPWLAVSPHKINLPVGGEKVVKLRAVIPQEQTGLNSSKVQVSCAGHHLLDVPVVAHCRVPQAILGSIRKQTLGAVASDMPVVRRFRVLNAGDGHLNCSIVADRPWIEILTPDLAIAPGKYRRVEYRISAPQMNVGQHAATIAIHTNGGHASVPVSVTVVEPQPMLTVLGDLDLGTLTTGHVATGVLFVRNSGVGLLKLQSHTNNDRVTVSPRELAIAPGPPAKLAVTISLDGLFGGEHSYPLSVTGNGGSGTATVRFRLPIEQVEVPSLLDIGKRLAGRSTQEVLILQNTSPDSVRLSIRTANSWIHSLVDAIEVQPGAMAEIPLQLNLSQSVHGELTGVLWIEGRSLRHQVRIQVNACNIELIVVPKRVDLGHMKPGEERAIVVQVANKGDFPAEINDCHIPGDLEVWLRRQTIQPGSTVPLIGCVKLNSLSVGKQLAASVRLAEVAVLRISARVRRPRFPRLVSASLAMSGLGVGLILGMNGYQVLGGSAMLVGLLLAGVFWMMFES